MSVVVFFFWYNRGPNDPNTNNSITPWGLETPAASSAKISKREGESTMCRPLLKSYPRSANLSAKDNLARLPVIRSLQLLIKLKDGWLSHKGEENNSTTHLKSLPLQWHWNQHSKKLPWKSSASKTIPVPRLAVKPIHKSPLESNNSFSTNISITTISTAIQIKLNNARSRSRLAQEY